MRFRSLCVGKPKEREICLLHDRYAERIARLGATYESSWVPETRAGGRYSDDHVREREAAALLEGCDRRGTLIALDPGGASLSSEQLAERLERWATPCATLLIGGPLGLHRAALEPSDSAWSLSPLTFPHEWVRLLVVEQLYRALTLLRGVPYHK